ncbi:unnamed protein product [Sphagnum balticum]
MQAAIERYGENVNLLRDLIVCQYHLQDMGGFRQNLERLENLLIENQTRLSPRSLFECELMLGKFLEEEARLFPARDFYLRALSHALNPPQRLRALIQEARWQALYEPSRELSSHYRELISVSLKSLTRDLKIELEHSLLLIELRLIGGDHAWQRVLRLGKDIPAVDQRLMHFDYVEGVLTHDLELSPQAKERTETLVDLDPYEEYIKRLSRGTLQSSEKVHELALLAPKLPWASYLRLLCLSANMEASITVRLELNRKVQLIIRALDPCSQRLWNQRLRQALQSPEIRLELSLRHRAVMVQGRHVDLSKKKIGMQLLEGLWKKNELSVDEAIALLWKSSFSPEHYHRLRMGIHRLNTLLNKAAGLGKIVEVDSQNVRLRPEVKLRQADEDQSLSLSLSL